MIKTILAILGILAIGIICLFVLSACIVNSWGDKDE